MQSYSLDNPIYNLWEGGAEFQIPVKSAPPNLVDPARRFAGLLRFASELRGWAYPYSPTGRRRRSYWEFPQPPTLE